MELKEKISKLLSVPEEMIDRMSNVIHMIHSDDIVTEWKENGSSFYKLETFEGNIYITIDENDELKYKFVPNVNFNRIIKETILTKNSKLIKFSLNRLRDSLINTYKDIF